MTRQIVRTLTFHQIYTEDVSSAKSRSRRGRDLGRDFGVDWPDLLSRIDPIGKVGAEDSTLGYVAHPTMEVPALSIVRPAKRGFSMLMRQLEGRDEFAIEDLVESPDFDLVNASAYYFLATPPGVLVVMQGDAQGASPPATALLKVLDEVAPQGPEREWRIKPLVAPSELARLKTADGAHRARFRASTGATVFSSQDYPELGAAGDAGVASIGRALQQRLGIPLEIYVDMKIPREYRTRSNEAALRDLVIHEAELSMFDEDGPRVSVSRASTSEIEDDVLTLAEHHVTTRVTLEQPEGDGLSFTKLQRNTAHFLARGGEAFVKKALEVGT